MKIEADLEQEYMLRDEMAATKDKIGEEGVFIERIKGLITLEDERTDYRLVSNFNEISVKSCKNAKKRLEKEELGLLVYGRNMTEETFAPIMRAFRTQMRSKV